MQWLHLIVKFLFGLSLILGLSACLNAKPKLIIDMEFSPAEEGLNLSIRFSKPVEQYTFFAKTLNAQPPFWQVLSEDMTLKNFTLTQSDGHRFVKANILIKPETNFTLSRIFVVTSIGDKGFLIVPDVFEDTDPNTQIRIVFKPQDDFIALQNRGERMNGAPYIRKVVLPLGMPFVYYGPKEQVNIELSRVVSSNNPEWIDQQIELTEDEAWNFYEALYQDYPVPRPLSVVAGFPNDAPYQYLGLTTIKGVIGYWLDLEHYDIETLKHRRDVEHLAAHETAHLWVGAAFRPTEPIMKRWLFEGLADYLAWKFIAQDDRQRFLRDTQDALNNCMDELGASNMNTVIPVNFTEIYECGLTVQILLDAGEYQSSAGAQDGLSLWTDIFEEASGLRTLLDWQDYQVLMSNSMIGADRRSALAAIFSRQHRLSWKHVLSELNERPNADATKAALKLFITQTGAKRWTKLPEVLAPLGINTTLTELDTASREAILKRFQLYLRVEDCEGAPDHMTFADNQLSYHWIPMGDDCPATLGPLTHIAGADIAKSPQILLKKLRRSCRFGDERPIDTQVSKIDPETQNGDGDDEAQFDALFEESFAIEGPSLYCTNKRAFRRYSARLSYQ